MFETKIISSTLYVRDKSSKKIPVKAVPTVNITPARWTTEKLQTQTQLVNILNKLITEDPKPIKGQSQLSYVASQIKQHHVNIKLDKYGYKKFTDLIIAIELYDVQLVNKTISIKANTKKVNATTPVNNPQAITKAWDEKQLKCDTKLLNSLRASIIKHPKADAERWVNFGAVGHEMKVHYLNFTSQIYGYTKLTTIIKKIGLFETKTVNSTLYVRHKTP